MPNDLFEVIFVEEIPTSVGDDMHVVRRVKVIIGREKSSRGGAISLLCEGPASGGQRASLHYFDKLLSLDGTTVDAA
jgi:hypothetical protein